MEETSLMSGSEISDSNSSSLHFPTHTNGDGGGAATPSKFKGVVSQSNGHWGAQIYANHQRIWLGTFKSEKEAAMAYDSASIKLRTNGGPHHRNFQWTETTAREPLFQTQFTTETVLNMIKDGSYAPKFSDYLRAHAPCHVSGGSHRPRLSANHEASGGVRMRQLFQKELTPSDVSKLNRLVIPKKYALKYFPRISDTAEGQNGNNGKGEIMDLELTFFDRSMGSWKFRYCYWKSSQSFVFTRGWNRFAKEKGLRSMDRVIFYSYECGDKKMCLIDVAYNNEDVAKVGGVGRVEEGANERMDFEGNDVNVFEDIKPNVDAFSTDNLPKKGFKLFGVQII